MGTAKPGSYPMADRANIFGTLYVAFFDKWNQGGTRDTCWPVFEGILGIAQSKADQAWRESYAKVAYDERGEPRQLTLAQMSSVVRESWALMERIGTYEYDAGPQDTEEIIIPERAAP